MSWTPFIRLCLAAICLIVVGPVQVWSSQDPNEDWVSAYGWLQAGERLAEAGHWPLAMGSYMEAHRKMKQMRSEHPAFEGEMVEYRIAMLEEEIESSQDKLGSGDHDLMVKFIDFAESFETGLDQRFDNRFVEALNTLDVAKVLLDEIIFEKPNEFTEALSPQYEVLQSSLTWLDGQINFRERERQQKSTFVGDGTDWGTTQFVKASDLPGEGEDILLSSELFPGLIQVEGPEPRTVASGEAEEKKDDDGEREAKEIQRPAFRMSSKQTEAIELPDAVEE
ncbi:MAG: hypothetical protein P1U68_05045 [Verrucomicrobiales bacterium]|nr:hypothetical protein [Verrucomicrobiales bacterium]